MPGAWLAQILDEWRALDFQAFQDRLDDLSQYIAQFGEQSIHPVRVDGKGPNPLPLLLTHGWPGSFLEHLKLIPLMTDPATHGGDAADAFTLIIPSLPGYGFTGSPPIHGLTARQTAELDNQHDRNIAAALLGVP